MSKFYIIHMFNKHVSEIASYLEQIASNGYAHIQISPVTLCKLVDGNVWWSRYQPLSYEIGSSAICFYDEIKNSLKSATIGKLRLSVTSSSITWRTLN